MGENAGKLHPYSTGKGLVADEFTLDEGEECCSVTIGSTKFVAYSIILVWIFVYTLDIIL